jgi:hypothetical protein
MQEGSFADEFCHALGDTKPGSFLYFHGHITG